MQYWYFSYDDFYSYNYPPDDFIWQSHEGDWESRDGPLRRADHPRWVGYSQHCTGERRSWSDTPRWHGSHASRRRRRRRVARELLLDRRPPDRRAVHPAAGGRVPPVAGARASRRPQPRRTGLRAAPERPASRRPPSRGSRRRGPAGRGSPARGASTSSSTAPARSAPSSQGSPRSRRRRRALWQHPVQTVSAGRGAAEQRRTGAGAA